jgi:predicted  nucleic acid-binding Zn-ribbon protein
MSDDLKPILDKLTAMEVRQGNIEQGIVNLGIRMEAVESGLGSLKETVAALDAKFDNQLQARLDSINSELVSFRADTERGFRALDRQMDMLSGSITRLQADQRDLEDRIDGLERKAS